MVTELVDRWWSQDERTQEWEGTEGLNCRASLSRILSVAGVTRLPFTDMSLMWRQGMRQKLGARERERERGFLLGGGGRVDREVPGKAVGLCSWQQWSAGGF